MSEMTTRQIEDILRRLDHLESLSEIIYQKGTYSPTYTGGTTAGVTTYTLQDGTWVRVGVVVVVTGQVVWTAATGTGEARVSLPFTPLHRGAGSLRIDSVTFANSTPQVLITGVNYFVMPSPLTNAGSTNVQMEAAGTIGFTVVHLI